MDRRIRIVLIVAGVLGSLLVWVWTGSHWYLPKPDYWW